MGLFTPTQEELENAKSGGRESIAWKDGDKPTLLIKEFKELPDKNLEVFVTTVVGGEHDGKEQAIFFRTNNKYDMADGLTLVRQFFSDEQLANGQANCLDIIGEQIQCLVKLTPKKEGEGHFVNFKYFKRVDTAPKLQAVSNSDIPF